MPPAAGNSGKVFSFVFMPLATTGVYSNAITLYLYAMKGGSRSWSAAVSATSHAAMMIRGCFLASSGVPAAAIPPRY